MGGFGSGKGFRTQSNKKRNRLYVTEVPSIHYKWLNLEDVDINRPIGRLYCKDRVLYFKMRTHIMHGGGIWYSFSCQCGRAPRILYLRDQQFACRHCHELAYLSENKSKTARSIDQKWKNLHKLGSNIDPPIRPKWMKRQTYDRVCQKIERYHQLAFARYFNYRF
jgi:hypothetical protein